MPLPREQYAFLSHRIYEAMTVKAALDSDTHSFVVRYVSPPSARNYRGAAVQSSATNQLTVINKGTDPTNVHDLLADFGLDMMGAPTQWPEAAQTMDMAHVDQQQIEMARQTAQSAQLNQQGPVR